MILKKYLPLFLKQIIYENKSYRRNPAAAFFTLVFPLLFLFMLRIFGNDSVEIDGGTVSRATKYIPMITAFSVIGSSYTGIAMTLTLNRDIGVLKRYKGTPLPLIIFLLGKIAHNTIVSFALAVIIAVIAFAVFDVSLPTNSIASFLLTMILGAATFTSLGIAFTSLIPNSDAAAPMVNASVIPLMFISDVFIPMDSAPNWLNSIAQLFPVRPFSLSLQEVYNPFSSGLTETPENYAILLAWLVIGLIASLKFFSWEPRK
ncbi:MAG: ABC transporter permease [Chloroflexota bacterium]|nr:ABC transporter permease [Chloroflexota bacterium]